MVRLIETGTTKLSREEAFRYIGDFGNVDKWDPGVVAATKATDGEPAIGTAYDVVVSYNGREMEMTYVITELAPGRKIVLEGTGARIKAIDVIDFVDEADGTLITYTADLSLTGFARFLEPLIKGRLDNVGEQAGIGLRRWLKELEVAAGIVG